MILQEVSMADLLNKPKEQILSKEVLTFITLIFHVINHRQCPGFYRLWPASNYSSLGPLLVHVHIVWWPLLYIRLLLAFMEMQSSLHKYILG